MSVAWSSLAGAIGTVAGAAGYLLADLALFPRPKGLAEVIHFGKFAGGVYVFGQLGRGAPEMIIGRARDMVEVAFFSRASGLVEIFKRTFWRAVLPVCLPYFAHGRREQGSVVNGYLTSAALLTAIVWPLLCFMAIA